MNFKEALYRKYVTSHLANRKGTINSQKLQKKSQVYCKRFARFLPVDKNSKILDLGSGSGGLVWWLNQCGFTNSKGIDGSLEQVEEAHRLGIKNIVQGDVFDALDFEKSCTLIFACDLIEHFEKQLVFDFLKKCLEALKPGGYIVLQVPNGESPYFGRIRYGDFTHETAFTASSIRQLLCSIGFEGIDVYPWRPVITGPASFVRHILWRLTESILKLPIQIESGRYHAIVTMNLIAVARKAR